MKPAADRHARKRARPLAGADGGRAARSGAAAPTARSSSSRRRAIGCRTRPLSEVGGKRLFVKEIEDALLAGDDRPRRAQQQGHAGRAARRPGRRRGAAARGSARRAGAACARGARFDGGRARTRRRAAHRHRQRPPRSRSCARCFRDARFVPIRGNVDTRLRKLDAGEYDALVLAAAGLERLGLRGPHFAAVPVDDCVPAPGQGIVAIEIARTTTTDDAGWSADRRCRTRAAARRGARGRQRARRRLPDAARRASRPSTARDWRCTAVVASLDGAAARPARGPRAIAAAAGASSARQLARDDMLAAGGAIAILDEFSTDRARAEAPLCLHRRRRPRGPGLITVRGSRCLAGGRRRHLRPSRATRDCCARARRTRRRSTSARRAQPLDQEAICYLLVEKAREGKIGRAAQVGRSVRLRQRRQGSAVPARAGDPVRGRSRHPGRDRRAGVRRHSAHLSGRRRHVTFVRGHEDESRTAPERRLGEPGAARRHDRVLRGGAAARRDDRRAAGHGRPPDETAAHHLRRHAADAADDDGTLRSCVERARDAASEPAMLVVGRVVGLREHLRWFDERPLFGRRDRRDAIARAGGRTRRAARGARRRSRSRRR